MNITKQAIDALNAELTIEVSPNDYESRVSDALKRVQRQAAMPGFRPGKVPAGLIKKQYGTQVLVDELNKLLNDSIYKFVEEQQLDILGNPMPKTETLVDWANQKDFTFKYDLGLAPQFNVTLDGSQTFTYKTVKIDEELVDKYVKDVRRNYGKPVNPETAGEKDVVFVDIVELDANGEILPGGVFKSTSISLERLKNEAGKAKLTGIKKEDKLTVSVNDLYDTALDKSISLGIDKEAAETFNSNLQLTVKNIARLEDADLNEELFDKVYGKDNVKTEAEFRDKIKHELSLMFNVDSDRFLRGEVENKLVSKLNLQLPDAFLKRWLKAVNEKPLNDEELEKEYPSYAKAMQWRLIENKIIKDNGIKVEAAEAEAEAKAYIQGEYARYGQAASEEEVDKIAKSLLSKEKEAQKIFENLYTKKVIDLIKSNCTLDIKEVSYEDFFKN
ncbi:MAG: trigger factor [Sediminibacterium sp.]|nr:trigger factor [Sediminibacterium sp.]